MGRTLSNKLATLPAARRKTIEGRAADLIAEEMSLRELRRALGRTQARVAQDLGIGQEAVSKLETRTDMLISTLARYVRKAGGRLTLVAEFPHRKPVKLKGLGDISAAEKTQARERAKASHAPA